MHVFLITRKVHLGETTTSILTSDVSVDRAETSEYLSILLAFCLSDVHGECKEGAEVGGKEKERKK